jgi:hypothetical protein
MDIINVVRVQGCATLTNILGFLDGELASEDIVSLKHRTTCRKKYEACCNIDDCYRYRIGTKGNTRVSWDAKGKRI